MVVVMVLVMVLVMGLIMMLVMVLVRVLVMVLVLDFKHTFYNDLQILNALSNHWHLLLSRVSC